MDWMIKAAQLILSLSILVILHELGHFIPARLFKTRVEKFYLFFDPWFSLFKFKRGETEYGVGWLPLGGYVKISGMIDESMDTEQMKKPPQPWEFRSKPAWQRLIIMIGGVTVNVILGMLIYAGIMFYYGDKYLPTDSLKDGIWAVGEVAQDMGFENGDKILAINGKKPEKYSEMIGDIFYGGTVVVERDGEKQEIVIPENIIGKIVDANAQSFIVPRAPFIIVDVPAESHNAGAGLQAGDQITGINGKEVKYADEIMDFTSTHKGEEIQLEVKREESFLTFPVKINEEGYIGVIRGTPSMEEMERMGLYELKKTEYGFFEAFPAGINKGVDKLTQNIKQLKMVLNPETGAYKGLGGFVSIGKLFGPTWNWQVFWEMTALLSLILAFMNILPIPALDGGHVMFLTYEMITRRKPHEKVMEYAQLAGIIILFTLLIYANTNDIIGLFR